MIRIARRRKKERKKEEKRKLLWMHDNSSHVSQAYCYVFQQKSLQGRCHNISRTQRLTKEKQNRRHCQYFDLSSWHIDLHRICCSGYRNSKSRVIYILSTADDDVLKFYIYLYTPVKFKTLSDVPV